MWNPNAFGCEWQTVKISSENQKKILSEISLITMYGFILFYGSSETNKRSLRIGNGKRMSEHMGAKQNELKRKKNV